MNLLQIGNWNIKQWKRTFRRNSVAVFVDWIEMEKSRNCQVKKIMEIVKKVKRQISKNYIHISLKSRVSMHAPQLLGNSLKMRFQNSAQKSLKSLTLCARQLVWPTTQAEPFPQPAVLRLLPISTEKMILWYHTFF